MRYDIEDFLTDVGTLLRDDFNSKVLEINAEKADTVSLKTVEPKAIYFQGLDEKIINYSPALFYAVSGGAVNETHGSGCLIEYDVDVYVLFTDPRHQNFEKMLLRYHSVLLTLFNEKWLNYSRRKAEIKSVDPAGFAQLNETQVIRASGITLGVTYGF